MRVKNILHISKWEINSKFLSFDLKTVLLFTLAVLAVLGIGMFVGPPQTGSDLYTVGVNSSSEYYPVVEKSHKLRVVEPNQKQFENGEIDILIENSTISTHNTQKGNAARSTLDIAIQEYNTKNLQQEKNETAAFPISVSVLYLSQNKDTGNTTEKKQSQSQKSPTSAQSNTNNTTVSDVQAQSEINGNTETNIRPNDVSQPFPFESLLYAFLFLLPLNFIVQAFASSIIDEKSNEHGKLLLSAPVSGSDIILGKAIPYILACLVVIAGVSVGVGAGFLSVVAILPLALLYLSLGLVAAIFSRSYKELTFFMLAISVGLMAYAFIPAIFTNLNSISSLSPLSVVVKEINGSNIAPAFFGFATVPLLIVSGLLYGYGARLYKEEYLFSNQSLPSLSLAGLSEWMTSTKSPFFVTAVGLPVVFVAELCVFSVFVVFPELFSLPVILVAIALVEEIAKSIHIYAGFKFKKFTPSINTAILVGSLSGFGFLVAEKLFVISQSVGLTGKSFNTVIFGGGLLPDVSGTIGIFILILWPFIHAITASISSLGARKSQLRWYILSVIIATIVHVGYNLIVVMSYGG